MAMGNSSDPDGGGPVRMLRGADQTVETTLEEKESNIRQDGSHRIQDTEYRIQNTYSMSREDLGVGIQVSPVLGPRTRIVTLERGNYVTSRSYVGNYVGN